MKCDTEGRLISFDIGDLTLMNMYGHSETDNVTRSKRETFYADTVTNLLVNSKRNGSLEEI